MNFIFNQRFLWWVFASRSEFDWGFISCPNPQRCIPHAPQYEILHFITQYSHLFRLSDDNGLANVASVPPHYNLCSKYCNSYIAIIIVVITINIIAVMIRLQQSQHCTAAPHWQVDCVQRCNRKKEDVKRIATDVKRSTQIFSRPQVYWLKWLGFEKVQFLCYCDF